MTIFLSLGTRWKPDGMTGRFYGLERADIWSTLQIKQIEPCRYNEIFDGLLDMESAALKELNRER